MDGWLKWLWGFTNQVFLIHFPPLAASSSPFYDDPSVLPKLCVTTTKLTIKFQSRLQVVWKDMFYGQTPGVMEFVDFINVPIILERINFKEKGIDFNLSDVGSVNYELY